MIPRKGPTSEKRLSLIGLCKRPGYDNRFFLFEVKFYFSYDYMS
jgi:hypothetical protein